MLVLPLQAEALKSVYDSRNYSANIATKVQMIEQVKNSAQQLKYDLQNLQKLDPSNLERSYYRIANAIRTMEQIRAQTDAIGTDYTRLMNEYSEINPDYSTWSGIDSERYGKQTSKLRDKWSKALLQALGITGIASPYEQQETAKSIEQLLHVSQNAEGAMGALQASNQLTAMMIAEQQKLQVLMADSMRSQNMYY
ncbi:MAG: hypothetical protein IJV92_04980, partial [Phascolarctobacterium sp.]|nr:hypothetical protein [Phascolarctobacterium sp.]